MSYLKQFRKNIIFLIFALTLTTACANKNSVKVQASVFREPHREYALLSSIPKVTIEQKDGIKSSCTAFPYEEIDDGYYFLIAAHCVADENKKERKMYVFAKKIFLHFALNPFLSKMRFRAVIVDIGLKSIGNDIAILKVKMPKKIKAFIFSKNRAQKGQCVMNVSYPAEGTGNIFYGVVIRSEKFFITFISKLGDIKNAAGSSGSAVFACDTGEILGMVVSQIKLKREIYSIYSDILVEFDQSAIKKGKK